MIESYFQNDSEFSLGIYQSRKNKQFKINKEMVWVVVRGIFKRE